MKGTNVRGVKPRKKQCMWYQKIQRKEVKLYDSHNDCERD